MLRIRKSAIVLASTLTVLSLAFTTPVRADDIQDLMNSAHDTFEGSNEQKRTVEQHVRAWLSNFDFNRLAHQAHRWALVKRNDPQMREHVLNIAFLFPASHVLEMMAGPIGAGLNEMMVGPGWLTGTFLATGTVISIPGMDPLCILLFLSYKHTGFQNFVTQSRLTVTHLANHVSAPVLAAMTTQFNPLENLRSMQTFHIETEMMDTGSGEAVPHISRIKLQKNMTSGEWNALRANIRQLGWNIGGIFNDIRAGRWNNPYILGVEDGSEFVDVRLESRAFPISPRTRLRRLCEISFRRS